MGRLATLALLLTALISTNGEGLPDDPDDGLFTYGGVENLRSAECVPSDYTLPETVKEITNYCLDRVKANLGDLVRLSSDLSVRAMPDSYRSAGSVMRQVERGIRDCLGEKLNYLDDEGNFVKEQLDAAIHALELPKTFERDVRTVSDACLHHTPTELSVEKRQNFYFICRDSLLEANCYYKKLERDDPDQALEVGVRQTNCVDDLMPPQMLLDIMDECRVSHNVPVKYAQLRRRRDVEIAEEEGDSKFSEVPIDQVQTASSAADQTEYVVVAPDVVEEPVEDHHIEVDEADAVTDGSGELPEEGHESLVMRVNAFIGCVHEGVGSMSDGEFYPEKLVPILEEFQGDERYVGLQAEAARMCLDHRSIEDFNQCYYDNVAAGCHIARIQDAFTNNDPTLIPRYR